MADIEENMKNLAGVVVIEKDSYDEVMPVWEYPSISPELESTLLNRSQLSESPDESTILEDYYFSKFRQNWIYTHLFPVEKSAVLQNVVVYEISIIANDFNPEKYSALCKVFGKLYAENGSGPKLLECYLSVFVKGTFSGFSAAEFPGRTAMLVSPLSGIIKMFQGSILSIWTALLTKKKIAVLGNSRSTLNSVMRALPLLVFHRSDWAILRPFTKLTDIEKEDWDDSRVVVFGSTDESLRDREELWDLLIDVGNREVIIPTHRKRENTVCQIQQDFTEFLIEQAETDQPESALIKALTIKTQELLKKLQSLKVGEEGHEYLDFSTLQGMNLPPNTDQFLYAVGSAEGMVKI